MRSLVAGPPYLTAEPAHTLPSHKLDTFLMTVEEAVDLARTGNADDGYEALLAGLHRATEPEGEPWDAELVTHRRAVLSAGPHCTGEGFGFERSAVGWGTSTKRPISGRLTTGRDSVHRKNEMMRWDAKKMEVVAE
jgi:hypothetical protein